MDFLVQLCYSQVMKYASQLIEKPPNFIVCIKRGSKITPFENLLIQPFDKRWGWGGGGLALNLKQVAAQLSSSELFLAFVAPLLA